MQNCMLTYVFSKQVHLLDLWLTLVSEILLGELLALMWVIMLDELLVSIQVHPLDVSLATEKLCMREETKNEYRLHLNNSPILTALVTGCFVGDNVLHISSTTHSLPHASKNFSQQSLDDPNKYVSLYGP